MDWLKGLLSVGRLRRPPAEQNAGRVLAPASVQRTQLGLREVDLPRGVVTLRTGEVRCFLTVTGFSAHQRSREEATAWLQGYARALNTLPGNAVLIARSRPGGLQGHLARQRAQTAALAEAAPGGALARLAADQLAHARHLQASGQVRQTDQYVALHSPRGDVARLLAAAGACRRHLAAAGVRAELVTDARLGEHLAASWHPQAGTPEGFFQDIEWPKGSGEVLGVLDYSPGQARITRPRWADEAEPPSRKASARPLPTRDGSGGSGKALPR